MKYLSPAQLPDPDNEPSSPLAAGERASQTHLAGIIDSAIDAIITVDAEHRICLFNPAAEKIFRCRGRDVLGTPLDRFLPDRFRREFSQTIDAFGDPGITTRPIGRDSTLTALRADGQEFPIEASISRVENEGQKLYILTLRDLAAHQSIQAQLEYPAKLIENVSDAIISTDEQFIIRSWNRGAEVMYGWQADQVIGKHSSDLFQTQYYSTSLAAAVKVLYEEGSWRGETTQQRRDGTRIDVMCSASLFKDAQGKLLGIVAVNREITASKRAQAANARLAAIVESSSDAILSITLDGIITTWNRASEQTFGYTTAEAIGHSILILVPSTKADEIQTLITRIQQGIQVSNFETVHLRRDGTPIDVSITLSPIRDAAENIVAISAVIRDITAQKRAQQVTTMLAAIVESSDDAIIGNTLDGIITSWNRGAKRIYLYSADEAIGRPISMLVPPPLTDELGEILPFLVEGESIEHYETRRVRKDGQQIDVSLASSPIRDASGHVVAVSTIARDITQKKRTEQQLRESIQRANALAELSKALSGVGTTYHAVLQTVVERIAEVVGDACVLTLLSEDGEALQVITFHHTDPAALALMAETLPGTSYPIKHPFAAQLVTRGEPLLVPQVDRELAGATGTPEQLPYLGRFGIQSTLTVPLRVQGIVIGALTVGRTRGGEPYQSQDQTFLQELSDRAALAISNARLYQDMEQLNAELEQRVADRTAALEAANQELEAFSYSVSHDLRAPLRAIDGFSHILERDNALTLSDKAQRHLKLIRENTRRMGTLIDDLLTFSQLGRQPLTRQTVDMRLLVSEIVAAQKAADPLRVVEVNVGELAPCAGDPALLRQLWLNLISNAFKYTRTREHPLIDIRSETIVNETVYSIQDNGVGFDMQYANKLFGVFQRLHRAEDYEGTGVGLAIVRQVVQRHGGRVWSYAELEQGAKFYFTLGA